ncbi:MAG: hypothetical protein OZ924_18055 [Burkholderiaceae bacterium]|nr:hypothetical protein [Burkholderiaceae bacterium]
MRLHCADCGMWYGDPAWVEAVVPDEVWAIITPRPDNPGAGILCINCIARRCVQARLESVPALITAGPLKVIATDEVPADWRGKAHA